MATANVRNQRIYVQKESSWGTIPNSGGTATVGNNDACRHINAVLRAGQGIIDRPDKTGTLSATIGVGGRRNATWSVSMSLAGSGAAGTVPDNDPFLEALFGKAGVVTPATKVQYDLEELHPSLAIYNFWTPASMSQQCAFGSIVQQARVNFGQDAAIIEFSGESKWVIDTVQFATASADAKGGLTTFPTEPASPVTNGAQAIGFTGQITLDGVTYTTLRTGSILMAMARELPKDTFNNFFPTAPAADVRAITGEFSLDDTDDSNLNALKLKAFGQTGMTLIFQIGTVAGNIWKFTLRNVLLESPNPDESQRKLGVQFNFKAHASSTTAKDEVTLEVL